MNRLPYSLSYGLTVQRPPYHVSEERIETRLPYDDQHPHSRKEGNLPQRDRGFGAGWSFAVGEKILIGDMPRPVKRNAADCIGRRNTARGLLNPDMRDVTKEA